MLEEDLERLQSARPSLGAEGRQLADFYQERVAELHKFFRLAQLILENLVGSEVSPDVVPSWAPDI